MSSLDLRIAELREEIDRYKSEQNAATEKEELHRLSDLIDQKSKTLDRLIRALRIKNGGGRLRDGIPHLEKNERFFSSSHIPFESEHASCARIVRDFPFIPTVSEDVLSAPSDIWRHARWSDTNQDVGLSLSYCSGRDIMHHMYKFLSCINSALNLNISFHSEVTIKEFRKDIFVLMVGMYMVGVIQFKAPGKKYDKIFLNPMAI